MSASLMAAAPAAAVHSAAVHTATIDVGVHHTARFLGLTFNVDTIWCTVIAGVIVLGLGLMVARNATSGVPGKVQLVWEMIVDWISTLVRDNIGRPDRNVIQLAILLFTFILTANWLELIPSQHYLPAPTSDLNLTLAMALIVIFGVHVRGIRAKGFGGYVKHYFEPYAVLFPLKLIEELVKPFTLALRLFGNIFAGGLMLSIIGLIPVPVNWPLQIVWKLFDMGIGAIQAFIFALLTVLYYAEASESHAHDEATTGHGDEEAHEGSTTAAGSGHASVRLPAPEPEAAGVH
jgi:F-type H+-transporting ATPase subunit a